MPQPGSELLAKLGEDRRIGGQPEQELLHLQAAYPAVSAGNLCPRLSIVRDGDNRFSSTYSKSLSGKEWGHAW